MYMRIYLSLGLCALQVFWLCGELGSVSVYSRGHKSTSFERLVFATIL